MKERFPAVDVLVYLLLLTAGIMAVDGRLFAQGVVEEPAGLERVIFELWPDYDRAALLVIETAVLPANYPLPARLRLPLPEEATLNAVAYNDPQGNLISIADYAVGAEEITVTTPAPAVRVEYYLPYTEAEGGRHLVNFTWTAPVNVGRVEISVQEPQFAEAFELTPRREQLMVTASGLRYHQLPPRTLAAGESLRVEASYALPGDRLTAPPAEASPAPESLLANLRWNQGWLLLGGGLLLFSFFMFGQGWRERRQAKENRRSRKPRRLRAKICENCGTENRPDDRFCRRCGKSLA